VASVGGGFDPAYFYKNPLKLIPALFAATVAFFVGGPPAAFATFAVVAGVELITSALFKPPETESNFDSVSPTYGFGQWDNRVKGDAVLPVVYTGSSLGHKIAPIYIQAYVTPAGHQDDDFTKVLKARGQGISGLLAICEGPVDFIEDIRLNDEPVVEKVERTVGTGNGSRKVFTFPAKRILLDTLELYSDSTLLGWNVTSRTWSFRANSARGSVFRTSIDTTDEIAAERELAISINGVALDTSDQTSVRPHIWMTSPTQMRCNMQKEYVNAPRVDVTYYVRTMTGVTARYKRNTDEVELVFATAPASGVKIKANFMRRLFPGLAIDWRNGAEHQLPIPGFESIRSSIGKGVEITDTEITVDTENEVDNVIINLASGPGGFTSYDDEGKRDPVSAQFRIEVKRQTATGTNVFDTYQQIPDPAGKKGSKAATEFAVHGDSIAQLFWSFSIRGLLDKFAADHPNNKSAQTMRSDFVRAKYTVRLKRTNTVKANTNALFSDNVYWSTLDEVIDEWLSYPGVAMLGFHAVASEKLQGSAPNVTCSVRGLNAVQSYDGTSWTADADNQGNRVWAAVDLLTHKRYGAGDFYTKASSIDLTSAQNAASWLDEDVTLEGGGTEVRSRLDLILDTRKSTLQWVMDILRPGRVLPVLQGNVWRFIIDDAVDLSAVTTVWEDGTSCRVAKDSAKARHDSYAAIPNEIQARFIDESDDWEFREVWKSPEVPTDQRRVQRIELFGITRRSEAVRTTNAVYKQANNGGMPMEFAVAPNALAFEAGDVIRFRSTRMGLDAYLRIVRVEFSTKDFFVRVQGIPYDPQVYGQQDARQTVPVTSSPTNTPPPVVVVPRQAIPGSAADNTPTTGTIARTTRRKKMPVKIRRVA